MQDCSNSNIFLKPLFRGKFDPFVNNANLGAIARISIVYRKICCNLHNAFMVRRLSIGKNNHLTCYSLAINPRFVQNQIEYYVATSSFPELCYE